MSLSVVSALARLGVDPWREAARLAGLPKPTAAAALAGMIGKLPAGVAWQFDAATCAGRLIELLPSIRPVAALGPAGLRRRRRSVIGFSELCLIVVLAVTGVTLAYQLWWPRAEPAMTTVSSSTPRLR